MRERLDRPTLAAVGLLALYFAVSIPVFLTQPLSMHHWLVWNVFLAMMPPLFAWLFARCRVKGLRAALAVLWLLFFPNATYMVTDLMHMHNLTFHAWGEGRSLYPWLTLLQVGIAVFLSTTMGLWSLGVMHRAIRERGGSAAGWAAVGLICAGSGYATYLGRFLRFNSWDVLNPTHLLQRALLYTDGFALRFSAAFGAYILFTYCVFRAFGALHSAGHSSR